LVVVAADNPSKAITFPSFIVEASFQVAAFPPS
jgi:hypothetical protein